MAAMTDQARRERVIEAYSSSTQWRKKVNAMSDRQVFAIYNRLKDQGKIEGE